MQPPVFATARLHLRPLAEADIPAIQQQFADYEVIRHLSPQVPWPYPEDGARDFVCNAVLPAQGKDRWVWALCLAERPGTLIDMFDPAYREREVWELTREDWVRRPEAAGS